MEDREDDEEEFEQVYELQSWIGEGASCAVHIGINRNTNEEVAVKVISKKIIESNPGLTKEINILKELDHPNIVHLIDAHTTKKNLYIVMELICGMPLFDTILEEKNFNERKAQQILEKLFSVLSYLHKKRIAHRDLKPENVIFSSMEEDAEPKVLDFGVSRCFCDEEDIVEEDYDGIGTLGYKAPEMVLNQPSKLQVDCWSMGVIAYIMLCGFPPFFSDPRDRDDQDQLMNAPFWFFCNSPTDELISQITTADFSFPEAFWKDISPSAKDFVSKLLVVDPNVRMSADQALAHPWMKGEKEVKEEIPLAPLPSQRVLRRQETVCQSMQVLPISPKPNYQDFLKKTESTLLLGDGRSTLRMAQKKWTDSATTTISFALPGGLEDFAKASQALAAAESAKKEDKEQEGKKEEESGKESGESVPTTSRMVFKRADAHPDLLKSRKSFELNLPFVQEKTIEDGDDGRLNSGDRLKRDRKREKEKKKKRRSSRKKNSDQYAVSEPIWSSGSKVGEEKGKMGWTMDSLQGEDLAIRPRSKKKKGRKMDVDKKKKEEKEKSKEVLESHLASKIEGGKKKRKDSKVLGSHSSATIEEKKKK